MLPSIQELKDQGLFSDSTGTENPYINFYSAQLIWHLFFGLGSSALPPAFAQVIELCGRNFELSRYVPDEIDVLDSISIDVREQNVRDFCNQTYYDSPDCTFPAVEHAYTAPFCAWGREEGSFTPIESDIFDVDSSELLDPHNDYFSVAIFCRVPLHADDVHKETAVPYTTAHKVVSRYIKQRADALGINIEMPICFSSPEWYFVFFAASLLELQAPSRAVIQIPLCLLSEYESKHERQLLLQLEILEGVLIAPCTSPVPREDTAFILLNAERQSKESFFFDCRPFGNQSMTVNDIGLLIEAIDSAWGNSSPGQHLEHWFGPDSNARTGYVLAPLSSKTAGYRPILTPLSKLALVKRGLPRTTLLKLDGSADHDYLDFNDGDYCYYVSVIALEDGSVMSTTGLSNIGFSPSDIYDLSQVDSVTANKIRTLNMDKYNLLVSRVGAPFKIALLEPASKVILGNYDDDPDGISFIERLPECCYGPVVDSIVVSDNTFSLEIDDGEMAHYLLAYFSSAEGQKALASVSGGKVLTQLSATALRDLEVPVPDTRKRKLIIDAFQQKQQQYEELKAELRRVEKLKKIADAPLG